MITSNLAVNLTCDCHRDLTQAASLSLRLALRLGTWQARAAARGPAWRDSVAGTGSRPPQGLIVIITSSVWTP